MSEIILIVAMAENRVIGKDNAMPWSIKGNLKHFKETTMGFPCIMGRKTWDSLPVKPLPGRLNIILSKSFTRRHGGHGEHEDDPNVRIYESLESAIESCAEYEKIFICGGESIYNQAMPFATKIDLTLIPGLYEGDTFFPEIDETKWKKTDTVDYDNFSVVVYEKEKS
ncbi:MAG: dihydrofolate reductase [Treponema sp.]|nr:dihydrofolate reductase [Treponema sp.]